jgi:Putative Ig domain
VLAKDRPTEESCALKKLFAIVALVMLVAIAAAASCVPTNSSLGGGTVGVPYSYGPLTSTGCTGTKVWSLSGGSFPPGSPIFGFHTVLGATAITGTPTTAGTYSGIVIHVCDSLGSCGDTAPLSIIIAAPALAIVQAIGLPAGNINQSYSATVTATGGTPPYTWSVTSGTLPAGLSLDASSGIISGTPTGSGRSTFTIHVHDSQGTPATADWVSTQIYIEGTTHSMYTMPRTASGFQFVPPASSSLPTLCKFAGPMITDVSGQLSSGHPWPTMIPDKYPDKATWATQTVDFLANTGWNACGFGSFTCISYAPTSWPTEGNFSTMALVLREDKQSLWPTHIKSLYGTQIAQQVCGNRYYIPGGEQGGGEQADVLDPGAPAAFAAAAVWQDAQCGGGRCIVPSNAVLVVEEGDTLFGFNQYLTGASHADMGAIVFDANPMVSTSSGGGYTFSDKLLYSKYEAMNFLASRYGCTGSPDPANANYCGDGPASTALAAFKSAWGNSSYTTWLTSDAGGMAGIHAGTYNSYGSGTGFLDEDGRHTIASAFQVPGPTYCLVYPDQSWSTTSAIETDGHDFVTHSAMVYGQIMQATWAQSILNPHPPLFELIYDGPSSVYTALAPYFDGFWINPNGAEGTDLAHQANRVAMVQRVIAASSVSGGKSIAIDYADYGTGNPDSEYPGGTVGIPSAPTQYQKGALIASDWQEIIHLQDANNNYVVAAFEHWSYYANYAEGWDGGLRTDFDNSYDGSASALTVTHSNTWQNSHTYPSPSIIWDGVNYEAKTFASDTPTSCVSGGSAPAWPSTHCNGKTTADGTCTWRCIGPYPLKPQTSGQITSTATLPGSAFGDAITPIANFLLAGICDPAAPSGPGSLVHHARGHHVIVH